MNPLSSFGAGIIGAFTPCALVLIPLVLARFTAQKRRIGKDLILFLLGFLISFSLLGLVLEGMFESQLKDGFSFGLGILFMAIGGLAFTERLTIANAPVVRNAFLAGLVFALAGALNPCVAPFLGIIISLNSHTDVMLHTILFGLGLITPALIAGLAGTSLARLPHLSHRTQSVIQKVLSIALILAGAYLVLRVNSFTPFDAVIAAAIILLTTGVILRSLFIVHSTKDLTRPLTLGIIISIIIVVAGGTALCITKSVSSMQEAAQESDINILDMYEQNPTCPAVESSCRMCADCMTTFTAIVFLGAGSLSFLGVYRRKKG